MADLTGFLIRIAESRILHGVLVIDCDCLANGLCL